MQGEKQYLDFTPYRFRRLIDLDIDDHFIFIDTSEVKHPRKIHVRDLFTRGLHKSGRVFVGLIHSDLEDLRVIRLTYGVPTRFEHIPQEALFSFVRGIYRGEVCWKMGASVCSRVLVNKPLRDIDCQKWLKSRVVIVNLEQKGDLR